MMIRKRIRVVDRFVRTGERVMRTGYAFARRRQPGQRRARVLIQFFAAAGLVVSLAVAATVVSMEIARAQSNMTATQTPR